MIWGNLNCLRKNKTNTARLRQYQKLSCKDNNLFKGNPKQLYRNNGKSQIKIKKAPYEEEIYYFGEKIWADSRTHNSQAPWIEKVSKEYEALKEQERSKITPEDLKHALKKSS